MPAEATFLREVLRDTKELLVLQKTSAETLLRLAEGMRSLPVRAGSVVVAQNSEEDAMFVIKDGQMSLERKVVGSTVPLARAAKRGDSFGAVTLLGNTPHKFTAVAKTDCTLFRLDRDVFDSIILAEDQKEFSDDEEDEQEAEVELQQDEEDEDEDDEDEELCSTTDLREIFVVSDSTGESASASVRTAMRQFDYCFGSTCGTSRTTVYRFVQSAAEAQEIARLAASRDALLVYTLMGAEVREALQSACRESSTEAVDLWGHLLEALERKFGAKRSGAFGRREKVTDEYMRIIKAIEYTRKVDDGVLPHLWDECDIMLIGPSRAGKTPLAFYLAQRGFKVANYPLVMDEETPRQLFEIDQQKCFALTIQPERLQAIRIERMKQFKSRGSQTYDNLAEIKKEISWMKTFYIQKGGKWPMIDTTDSSVVETAARIMQILDRRKGNSLDASYVSTLGA